ncbi:MAG TPA: hypothetical protein VEJ63_18870 [Planctomycetota bacterium]|nr:hypothetical protein [Planctomycetota bacterium]
MAIPTHYIKKRDLLHSEKTSPATLAQVGCEFLKLERFSDALDFFEKCKDAEGIAQIKKIALERGDSFLLARLDRYDRSLVSKEEWETAAAAAESAGKGSMSGFVKKKVLTPAAPQSGDVQPSQKPGEEPLAEV